MLLQEIGNRPLTIYPEPLLPFRNRLRVDRMSFVSKIIGTSMIGVGGLLCYTISQWPENKTNDQFDQILSEVVKKTLTLFTLGIVGSGILLIAASDQQENDEEIRENEPIQA